MKLLHELQALVGPKFGFTITKQIDSLCDTLAADLDHFLGAGYRFYLMHHIFPMEFMKDDGLLITSEIVQYRISRYLKEILQSQKARSAESESGWFKSLLGDTGIESPWSGSSRTD
jgi:hypothetical protein